MKKLVIGILTLFELSVFISCSEQNTSQKEQTAKAQVKITQVAEGYLPDNINVTGKTIYLNKNTILAPIRGYITKVNVLPGDKVLKGEILFKIQSPEAYIVQQTDTLSNKYGLIDINAPENGIITSVDVMQQDVYIDQGSSICTILASNNLKVQVDVPFEFRKYAQIGKKCEIILPDNTSINAIFTKILPQMNEQSQTIKVLANLISKTFIPENMIVKICIDKSQKQKSQILSKKCLLSNALMTNYWVMKLINDSVAVKIPVTIGNLTHTQVEVLTPKFNIQDKIISEGAYGLSDSVQVEVID